MQACTGYASYEVASYKTMQVSVNGTIPVFTPGSAAAGKVAYCWDKWKSPIKKSCGKHGIPINWFVGIMSIESGGDPAACSPPSGSCGGRCCAYGLMQFIDIVARDYGKPWGVRGGDDLIRDPSLAIELAAMFLRDRIYEASQRGYRGPVYGYDLPRIAASYNAGSPRCTGAGTFGLYDQVDYAYRAVKAANTAVALGIPTWASGTNAKVIAGLIIGLGGLGAAAYLLAPKADFQALLRRAHA